MTNDVLILSVMAILMTVVTIKALAAGRLRIFAKWPYSYSRVQNPFWYWFWIVAFAGATGFLWFEIAKAISV